jgi:hypothetical protein
MCNDLIWPELHQEQIVRNGPVAVASELLNEWQLSMNEAEVGNDGFVSETRPIHAEREFLKVALWPRRLGPGCGVLVANPLALLRLSLLNAGWRPVPRA